MNLNNLENLVPSLTEINAELARRSFKEFVLLTKPDYKLNWHHELLMEKLQLFAEGKIKKLMVFMPPQHGKSELTSRRLPAYLLGLYPHLKIAGCSYSGDIAKGFSRDVKRIMGEGEYRSVFQDSKIGTPKDDTANTSTYFEIVDNVGYYISVGIGGSLTSKTVDIGIIDDPVKDAVEAGSPTYRARAWSWYTDVFLTRLHNDSQILITQTRWHEDDLSGRVKKKMKDGEFEIVLIPGILENDSQRIDGDPRNIGEALWEGRHSLESLLDKKDKNPRSFQALYQQDPKPHEGGLVYPNYNIITRNEWSKIKQSPTYGLDFGYSDSPAALIEVIMSGDDVYLRRLVYKSKLGISDLVSRIKAGIRTNYSLIIADSAEPQMIDHLKKKQRLNVKAAIKGPNSVNFGISLLQSKNIYVHEDSHELIEELNNYRYKEDADGKPLEEPIKEYDHLLDAARYVVMYKEKKGGSGILSTSKR